MEKFNQTASFQRWLISHLRRISYRYGPRYRVKKAASKGRGQYECAGCGEIYGPREIQLDHVEPVIEVRTGFKDWNTFIDRLFADEEGYQVLCKTCHAMKTVEENKERGSKKAKSKKKAGRKNSSKVQKSRKSKKTRMASKRKPSR